MVTRRKFLAAGAGAAAPAGTCIAVWDYDPNLGYDYGGRLVAAWLDR